MSDMSNRIEYRAIYRQPASILDSDEDRARGYVERATKYGTDKVAIRQGDYSLRRTEESLAYIVRWERRNISVGDWEIDADG